MHLQGQRSVRKPTPCPCTAQADAAPCLQPSHATQPERSPPAPTCLRRLFEKQPRWSFPQLQKDTHQPTQHLKEVLGEIAVKNLRGPYKDLWELKKGALAP